MFKNLVLQSSPQESSVTELLHHFNFSLQLLSRSSSVARNLLSQEDLLKISKIEWKILFTWHWRESKKQLPHRILLVQYFKKIFYVKRLLLINNAV